MDNVPKSVRVNTGGQHVVQPTIDRFFVETKYFIESHYNVHSIDFEIKSGEIAYLQGIVTDNRVTYLLCKQRITAIVTETRDDFNYIWYHFFRNLESLDDFKK